MSNLSEEEIIKNLNNVLEKWQEIIKMEDEQEREIEMSMYFEEMPFYEIQGLLDLYQQEKEKNIKLQKRNDRQVKIINKRDKNIEELKEIANKDWGERCRLTFKLEDCINKDKIREKIKELDKKAKQQLKGVKGQDRYFIKQIYHSKRSFGEELLEEE